jgi:membrane-associated phospholipid phosphatase
MPERWVLLRTAITRNVNKKKALLFGREILFILAIYFLYQLAYLLVGRLYPQEEHKKAALRNAHNLVKFETVVGLHYLELLIQHFYVKVLNIAILMKGINAFYLGFHLPVSLCYFFHLAYSRVANEKRSTTRTVFRSDSSSPNSPHSAPLQIIVESSQTTETDTIDEKLERKPNTVDTSSLLQSDSSKGSRTFRSCVHTTWTKTKNLASLRVSVRDYKRFRWSLFIMHLMFAITIIVFPVAPPRMLPEKGYVDTIIMYSRTDITKTEERFGVNPYAAMPSLHFSYALFVGIGYYFFAIRRWLRVLGVAYTIWVGFVIVITGNHYFMDSIGALIYCSIAVYLSGLIVNYTSRHEWRIVTWLENKCQAGYERIFGKEEEVIESEEQQLIVEGEERGNNNVHITQGRGNRVGRTAADRGRRRARQ